MEITAKEIKKNRRLWINALRSGKYKQGKNHLHNTKNNTYCCLGVACDLFAEKYGVKRRIDVDSQLEEFCSSDEPDNRKYVRNFMPRKLQKVLGLYDGLGRSEQGPAKSGSHLYKLNDNHNYSFDQIADALATGNYWESLSQTKPT